MNEVLKAIKSRRSVRAYTEIQDFTRRSECYFGSGKPRRPVGIVNYQTWHFTAIQNTIASEELNRKD